MWRLGYLIMFMFSPIILAFIFARDMWQDGRRLELFLIIFAIIAIQQVFAPASY